MSVQTQFEQNQEPSDRRRSPRRSLKLEAAESPPSAPGARVVIHDLSLTGLLIETTASVAVGERFQVQIPEAGEVEAEFVWNSGSLYGCRFTNPISKAALSAALLKSPALNFEESMQAADAVAELRTLRSTVGRLTATVDALLEDLSDRPQAPARIQALPDVPARVRFSEEDVRTELDRTTSSEINVVLMASLTVALLMVAVFIYALLRFQFSV